MVDVSLEEFGDFFFELHGHAPYSWQRRLAERAVYGDWPGAIDLPTGSGKTACIDVAVFAMACQASLVANQRTAPRRLFFAVNRRVIVDEAYERSRRIARKIWQAEHDADDQWPVLRRFAQALRSVGGTTKGDEVPPLDALELRGGVYRDNRWARSATQPTIICTTIDQLGSRLLFRGYGVSPGAAPIQAALIAYDSLVLLDEAHISEPFRQTLGWVQRYLDPETWAETSIGLRPLRVVPMTATLPDGGRADDVIRLNDGDRANECLCRRLTASKPAKLCCESDVAETAVRAGNKLAEDRTVAVGVIVNRLATAKKIYEGLRQNHPDKTIELVIGSMRPIDRDQQAERLRTTVGPDRPQVTEQTSFVVATQCLEVGADYDFDVLVTECASLDALRQRFGRLNRSGREIDAKAVIIGCKSSIKPEDHLNDDKPLDPIYGNAAARTWNWLIERAQDDTVDFGIDAFDKMLPKEEGRAAIPKEMQSPSASLDAPVMLPAYVDIWCQTSPRPTPEPDVALFLHGPQRAAPDVQVCWRKDLVSDESMSPDHWPDVVALLPPTSVECMSVPLSRVRRWLENQSVADGDDGDLLGVAGDEGGDVKLGDGRRQHSKSKASGVLWRGVSKSELLKIANDLQPGDTLVLPVDAGGWDELGHIPLASLKVVEGYDDDEACLATEMNLDIAEQAFIRSRDRAALRLHPALRQRWPAGEAIDVLFRLAGESDAQPSPGEWQDRLRAVAEAFPDITGLKSLAKVRGGIKRAPYPDGRGVVLTGRGRLHTRDWLPPPALEEGDDDSSRTSGKRYVTLSDHTSHVCQQVKASIQRLPLADWQAVFELAAQRHDLGKADERFQAMLRRSDRTYSYLQAGAGLEVWAKSDAVPQTPREYEIVRTRAGLPRGFRHEMLSAQLAERSVALPADENTRQLVLHLIATHHGYGRPFAPVVIDDEPPDVEIEGITVLAADRLSCPAHRLDSGVAERFWALTRYLGWWAVAYLEAVLRLADQQASAAEDAGEYDEVDTESLAEAMS